MPKNYCEHCGQEIKDNRTVTLTKSRARILMRIGEHVKGKDENLFIISDVSGLSKVDYTDYPKLRYFGLIAKHKVEGEREPKEWVITTRGFKFLAGMESGCHPWVKVKNNEITERPELTTTLSKVWADAPYLETRYAYSDDDGNDLGERSSWDRTLQEPAGFDGDQARLI